MMRALLARLPRAAGLLLLFVAALRLQSVAGATPPPDEGLDLVVCLDVSRSMRARDVAPDRLRRAQAEIAALAEAAAGDRIGLVLFAGEARLLVPRTQDGASLAELAARAGPWDVPRGGTDLAAALETARQALVGRAGPGAIVLLTDGEDVVGRALDEVLAALRADALPVHVLGLGSSRGAKIPTDDGFVTDAAGREVVSTLDVAGLRRVAAATDGSYADASGSTLPAIHRRAIAPQARARRTEAVRAGLEDASAWWLLAALLCLLVDTVRARPRRRLRPLGAAAALLLLGLAGCGAPEGLDPEVHATFLRGNAAYADSLALEAEAAHAPEAQKGDLMRAAYRRAEDALAAWQWAAATRADWPSARRNVERGLLRMQALRERGTEGGTPQAQAVPGEDAPGADETPEPPTPEVPERPEAADEPPTEPTARIASGELPPARVLEVLQVLERRQRQKIDLRKARRTVRPAPGGRDW